MRNAARNIARIVRERVGTKSLGIAFSLIIIAAATVTLVFLLRDIDVAKVIAAIRDTSLRTLLVSAGLVACSYLTLTCYDFFALRTIGRREVPYPVAALAGVTSYTIGHNIGATAITGGLVRYRIYSAHGLSAVEVAKVAFITGLTFWLGNVVVLGLGMTLVPEAASAITQLPAVVNRAIGIGGLAVVAGYLVWLLPRRRFVGRNHWQVRLPSAPLTLVQIGIGVADLTCVAAAMYTLLPSHPPLEFLPLLVTFVAATVLGFLSHAPGSIGVFDAAMLIGLWMFEKEQLLASLLIFRCLYFLVPFCFGLLAMGIREARLLSVAAKTSGSRPG